MPKTASTPPLVLALAALAAAVLALAGCGSSSDSTGTEEEAQATTSTAPPGASAKVCKGAVAKKGEVRVTGISCSEGKPVVATWNGEPNCHSPASASRYSCTVGQYTCLAAKVDMGVAVNCSRPGRSISFIAKPR